MPVALRVSSLLESVLSARDTHCEIAIGAGALGEGLADMVQDIVLALAADGIGDGGRRLGRLFFELDRHGV